MTPPPKPSSGAQHVRGVLVLGMHRSGTSVVAGILERLGLDGGPRSSMLAPDQFNSDGYWEQRGFVDWHDRILATLRGWASAPPPTTAAVLAEAAEAVGAPPPELAAMCTSPWFLKDPRQCLLLPAWTHHHGNDDSVVLVGRRPEAVMASLSQRNGYSAGLAAALWERYNHDVLQWLPGRPCFVVDYDELCAEPAEVVGSLAGAIGPVLGRPVDDAAIASAVALIRPGPPVPSTEVAVAPALWELIRASVGAHRSLDLGLVPPVSAGAVAIIERRRRRLNRIRPFIGRSSAGRAALDQLPARVRATIRRGPRGLSTNRRRAR